MSTEVHSQQSAFLYDMRMAFYLKPRTVIKRTGDHHARMAEHWIDHAHKLGQPGYTEAPGFTRDKWQINGSSPRWSTSVKGREKPYGYGSRTFWRYVRLAMREAFLSGWHDTAGTTYTVIDDPRYKPILTGITA